MKKVLFLIMILTMVFTAVGCGDDKAESDGNNNQPVSGSTIDAAALAGYVIENVTFKDQMDVIDNDILCEVYGIDSGIVNDACSYFSTGATAEEVTVINTTDTDAVKSACENRIENQIEGFENYVPEELIKLDNPFIKVDGDTVIMVVCDDTAEAEAAVNSFVNN